MYIVKFIIVKDSCSKSSNKEYYHRFVPNFGHCIFVNSTNINTLCEISKLHANAKVMGESEVDLTDNRAPIKVNSDMNKLRRLMSDYALRY
jgi:hypothetical protein